MVKKLPPPPPVPAPTQIPAVAVTQPKRKRKKAKSKAKANPRPPNDRGQGGPPFVPTEEHRRLVALGAGLGMTNARIRMLVLNPRTGKPIGRDVVAKAFPDELEQGKAKAHFNVGRTLYEQAVGIPKYDAAGKQIGWISEPNTAAMIFFAKTQMGWQEQQTQNVVIQQFENFILAIGGNVAALRAIRDAIPPPENG